MKRLLRNLVRVATTVSFLAGWTLAAASLHVIWTPDVLPKLVTKDSLGFGSTFVDTRGWTLEDAATHPTVVKRLLETGRLNDLAHVENFKEVDAEQVAATAPPSSDPELRAMLDNLLEKLRSLRGSESSDVTEEAPAPEKVHKG